MKPQLWFNSIQSINRLNQSINLIETTLLTRHLFTWFRIGKLSMIKCKFDSTNRTPRERVAAPASWVAAVAAKRPRPMAATKGGKTREAQMEETVEGTTAPSYRGVTISSVRSSVSWSTKCWRNPRERHSGANRGNNAAFQREMCSAHELPAVSASFHLLNGVEGECLQGPQGLRWLSQGGAVWETSF